MSGKVLVPTHLLHLGGNNNSYVHTRLTHHPHKGKPCLNHILRFFLYVISYNQWFDSSFFTVFLRNIKQQVFQCYRACPCPDYGECVCFMFVLLHRVWLPHSTLVRNFSVCVSGDVFCIISIANANEHASGVSLHCVRGAWRAAVQLLSPMVWRHLPGQRSVQHPLPLSGTQAVTRETHGSLILYIFFHLDLTSHSQWDL